ncbi:transcriptional regulator [Rivularia sp. PCC 7116]|uniref:TetR/AcrR family transcriptional regulator n=1 Tax=Rivularia sp. PCC 7116 TaxID=373994 RepID=UPI00029F0E70|nr:TetR/AcrR family transcriptional regulator [Rivularia sp. PCC 7116]AFY55469.1 transcriptional regulator [Rivularia sp. PCC 7116]
MPRKADGSARERILEVASELFYQYGIQAVGVDRIIAESGVAKTTLYRYFPSKDDLVVAFLKERNRLFWEYFDIAVGKHPDNSKAQLLAVFEWIDELLVKPECYGCPFLITTSEFPQLDYPGHQVAIAHKQEMRLRLTKLAENAGIPNSEQLGKYLLLLVDGAFSQRRLFGLNGFESNLKDAAEILINAQL